MISKTKARELVGGLSKPGKMPGFSYGLPAWECNVGSKLRLIPNSVCSTCYALKSNYVRYPAIRAAQYRRLALIDSADWVTNMITAIGSEAFFRWHDAGDLVSVAHLKKIVDVCNGTPETRHWLPTREAKLVRAYLTCYGPFPANLTVRLSATMIDGLPPARPAATDDPDSAPRTSTVHKLKPAHGFACPAPTQGNKCNDCRACWDRSIQNVSYHAH